MTHILFVDDDPAFLGLLERSLQPRSAEWKMEFAASGEQGRQALHTTDFDVVVTDMVMPGVDGTQVLACAREYSPKTIRLVLSGAAEQRVTLECVGLAHQYLAKPCDVEVLRKVITRVTQAGFALRNERVMTLVAKLKQLPSLPAIYLQLVRLMNKPDVSMEAVGQLIGSDMAMTAKVLQLVNSSFFGLARSVANPAEAVSFLGLDTLKALVLAAGVFAQYERRTARGFSASEAAKHSRQVGALSRALARCERASSAVADQALVAGLLHDIGKMVLASNLPEEYQRALQNQHVPPLEAERAVFSAHHAEIGGYLLGLWGLPDAVVQAITLHHAPAESGDREFSPLTAVHVANCLLAEQEAALPVARRSALDTAYLDELGLTSRLPAWREAAAKVANARPGAE